MIGYDKIFFQGVKKMEKEKGKREIGDNGMRKEREDWLGYRPFTLLQEFLNSHVMADYVTTMLSL